MPVQKRPHPHRLSGVDPEARTGVCAACGPVAVAPKKNSRNDTYRWVCKPHYDKRWTNRKRGPDHVSTKRRKIGVQPGDVERMLDEQNGLCGGCGDDLRALGSKMTHVDHCHGTGKIRGLLCFYCNTALGLLKDNPTRARRLADYIERVG